MKKLEDKLQHKIIMAFGQRYPEFRDCLVEINNDTFSRNHAMKRRSMGMMPGASDLFLFHPNETQSLFIELKAEGTEHDANHVKTQLAFGESRKKAGHLFIMDCDFDRIMKIIEFFIEENKNLIYCIEESEQFLEAKIKTQFHKKSITFA